MTRRLQFSKSPSLQQISPNHSMWKSSYNSPSRSQLTILIRRFHRNHIFKYGRSSIANIAFDNVEEQRMKADPLEIICYEISTNILKMLILIIHSPKIFEQLEGWNVDIGLPYLQIYADILEVR